MAAQPRHPIDHTQRMRVALRADVSLRSVEYYLDGFIQRPTTVRRIERALRELELGHLVHLSVAS